MVNMVWKEDCVKLKKHDFKNDTTKPILNNATIVNHAVSSSSGVATEMRNNAENIVELKISKFSIESLTSSLE